MKIFKKFVGRTLLLCLVYSCSSSSDDLSSPDEVVKDDTLVVESLTENVFNTIFEGFSITEIINSGSSNNTTPNYESISSLNKVSSEDCNFEITNTLNNTSFKFDLTRDYQVYPHTADEILSIINAPVISTTESSIKYFLTDGTPSTDCATEELDVPVPNYNNRDELLRPTFFSYDDIFDYTGEHHYSNKFYIERNETTTPKNWMQPSSEFETKGTLEKRVDRVHQVHFGTERKESHIENLNLTGFFKSNQAQFGGVNSNYKFEFINGSTKYFKYSYSIVNELEDPPTYGNTEIDMVNRYVVRFFINYSGRNVPFSFDITIDYKEIIKTLKENNNSVPYTKTVPFYLDTSNRRSVGTLTFKLDTDERWVATLIENPTVLQDSDYE